jgi:hypothetical protein
MEEAILKIRSAITDVTLNEELDKRVKKLRISALRQMEPILKFYYNRFGQGNPIVITICEKKIAFILDATTKNEIALILTSPKVHYNFNSVVPANQYVIPEEELLIWSLTSLEAPLNEVGFNRYMELFQKIFPEYEHLIKPFSGL